LSLVPCKRLRSYILMSIAESNDFRNSNFSRGTLVDLRASRLK